MAYRRKHDAQVAKANDCPLVVFVLVGQKVVVGNKGLLVKVWVGDFSVGLVQKAVALKMVLGQKRVQSFANFLVVLATGPVFISFVSSHFSLSKNFFSEK